MPQTIRVFVPVGRMPARAAASAKRAPRAVTTIGLLDNHKRNTDRILDRVQERLAERYHGVRFVRIKKPEAGKPAPEAVIEALAAQCQAVINGIGD